MDLQLNKFILLFELAVCFILKSFSDPEAKVHEQEEGPVLKESDKRISAISIGVTGICVVVGVVVLLLAMDASTVITQARKSIKILRNRARTNAV